MRLTKEQLRVLKLKWVESHLKEFLEPPQPNKSTFVIAKAYYRSFLSFRRSVQPTFGLDGAVTVKWSNLYLCIETDGYTHNQG